MVKMGINRKTEMEESVRQLVRREFRPHFGKLAETFPSIAAWQRLQALGSNLWLDTGSIDGASELWTREFTALTTNNTLLNKEVQTGRYDALIGQAAKLLAAYDGLSDRDRLLEIAFILNARHALHLVEKFDAYVSVEEHTDLAHDVDSAVRYAHRYHEICPERFYVKIPFTAAGVLATRRVCAAGVAVNHTLGFSARQNYVIARIARPEFVNVFLGRLNSFVADNDLGDGTYIGEKATLATQRVIRKLRKTHKLPSRLIGASFRSGQQVRDLAGIDVMTMPTKVAKEFLDLKLSNDEIVDKTAEDYRPPLRKGVDPKAIRLDTLWDVDPELVDCVDALEKENPDSFTPDDLIAFFADHGCGDIFVKWTDAQIKTSADEGKIPRLETWRDALAEGAVGLDTLLNLAGLNSFAADQQAMDERVAGVLASR
jgi:transaldolase